MKTVNRFCRECYQTTPHEVKNQASPSYACTVCIKSGKSIWMEDSDRKEPTTPRRLEKEDKLSLKVLIK